MRENVSEHVRGQAQHLAWFRILRPASLALGRIICLPHAGGSASFFHPWAKVLPPAVELVAVQYPGREERIEEGCIDNMRSMVGALVHALTCTPQLLSKPYVLFGHSMGAAVAYELCLALQRHPVRLPCLLALSAIEGPGRAKPGALHRAGDRVLLDEVVRLNPRLAYLLSMTELSSLVLPALRNDYRLIETYGGEQPSFARLSVPVVALRGQDDSELSEEDARAWERVCDRSFQLQTYSGGHFYLTDHYPALTDRLTRAWVNQSLAPLVWPDLP